MATNAKNAALVIGIVFLIVGVLGFIPNPVVGPTGYFVANATHDWVHIVSGIVLLLGAFASAGSFGPGLALRFVGAVYALIAVVGFLMPADMMFGMVAMNAADRWLHVVLAIVILYSGFGLSPATRPATA
ncbi:MAG TPA: DUF4383 domain-containing protein [Rhizomicrobium sp.]